MPDKCLTCQHFKLSHVSRDSGGLEAHGGECRFSPPHPLYRWPNVRGDDWCGQHKEDIE